jgi:transcriptional regulator with XRE-family HTH domain
MFLKENFKLLRKRMKRSQNEVANILEITRSAYNSYENGVADPSISLLIRIADFYKVNLDKLVRVDLNTLNEQKLEELGKGYDIDITGSQLRVIATSVDSNDKENVELVPIKARAGYTSGYADPSYIKVLPAFNMPFLSENKKYRTFPITGDSMPPVLDKAWVTGEYLQDWNYVDNGKPYIVVTKEDGIVFKVIYNRVSEDGTLLLCSTNPNYEPYSVHINDVIELWKFVNYINPKFEEPTNSGTDDISSVLRSLQKEVSIINNKMDALDSKI